MHDVVIRNALVLDGTGKDAVVASVAIDGDRIVAVGQDIGPGKEVIDAAGLALMPGIIDAHTHYDAQLTWDSLADPSLEMGVTTAVIGNCGFTIAPCRPEDRDLTMRNLTQVEGMSLDALRSGIKWEFETVPQYLDMLQGAELGINVAALVGHSAVRTYVMGAEASSREATEDEIRQMAAIVQEAMAHGAVGFSTSTGLAHNGEGGIPMPSRLASEHEFTELAKAMGADGRGIFMITRAPTMPVEFLESIAAESGRPALIAAFLHNTSNPDFVFDELAKVRAARERGRRLYPQVSCLPLTFDFSLHSAYVFEGLDAWKPAMKVQGEAQKDIYRSADFRDAVRQELKRIHGRGLFNSEWDKVHVSEVALDEHRDLEGRSVAELSERDGKDPLDWLLDFSLSENLDTLFTAQLRNTDESAVARLINVPEASVALSDAGAHITFMCDAGYGLHLLGHWSRDKNAISLPHAVHKLTGHPAEMFGIQDRGRIEPGMFADLMLFNPETIKRGPNQRVFDLPSGAKRQRATGQGVLGVWVNGQRVVDESGVLAQQPRRGRVLREFAA